MTNAPPQFSQMQWEFLATLNALGSPAPIDVIGELVPLTPGPLFDLIRRAEQLRILQKTDGDIFELSPNVSPEVMEKIQALNSPERISRIIDQLANAKLMDQVNPKDIVSLLVKARRYEEAATAQLELTGVLLNDFNVETTIACLIQAFDVHLQKPEMLQHEKRLITQTLTVSNLCIALGKGFVEVLPLLMKARTVSELLGDRRSHGIILLHLGRLYYLSNMNAEMLKALLEGKQIVEELGDEDILFQSAEFVGLFYFMQGNYKQALIHYERASEWGKLSENDIINPFAPVFFSLTALALGQFNRAITLLDIFHRIAIQKKQSSVATTLRAVLGYMLLTVQKDQEALYHLSVAHEDAKKQKNALALYGVRLFKAYHNYLKGNLTEARDFFVKALDEAAHANIIRAYAAYPWVLEMLFEFDRRQVALPPDFSFEAATERVMQDINISLKGVLMRLLAKRAAAMGESIEKRQSYLETALNYLTQSGSSVQLAKTRLELARLELTKKNRKKAAAYARAAWQGLPGYAKSLFPDDLQHLIDTGSKGPFLKSFLSAGVVFNRFSETMEKLIPASDLKVIITRLVMTTNRFFSAERGGFFLLDKTASKGSLKLLAAANMTELEVNSESFSPNIKLIMDVLRQNRAIISKPLPTGGQHKPYGNSVALCFPITHDDNQQGVLYHDNSFLMDCFDFLDDQALVLLKNHLETLCRHIWEYCRSAQKKNRQAFEKEIETETALKENIIGQSPAIRDLLNRAQRIADADSPILLQGETGVGKEIMARWIHKNSPRRDGAYVIIDSTTIAENLLESELFGHEKGAFTGADHQKAGRVELANRGTLFLDEVGELPLSIQAKLLRILEEKTFTRVGGSRVHRCDFRLIAATNRDLDKEVKAGRFRKDLFYRLNVLPLRIPPLRERKEDIALLAEHFLARYCKKLNRPQLQVTPAETSALLMYPWPGNVRELKNVIERGALLSNGHQLELQLATTTLDPQSFSMSDMPTMDELQRRYIVHVLKTTGGKIGGTTGAADILGMNRSTLYFRMKKLNMPLNPSPEPASPED
jgi:transcriptional regulator with GAF, ATPase, and Fis domain/tetratricopeptide (TPR) repeat protein